MDRYSTAPPDPCALLTALLVYRQTGRAGPSSFMTRLKTVGSINTFNLTSWDGFRRR